LDAERQRQIDEAHRAIGHYITEFSQLVACMRWYMAARAAGGGQEREEREEREVAEIPLGVMQAKQICDTFFHMCRQTNDLNENERAIEKWLRGAVGRAVTQRNNYAHGDWWVGLPATDEKLSAPHLLRIRPRPSAERAAELAAVPVHTLDKQAEELSSLLECVREFGVICLEQPARRARSPDAMWWGTTQPARVEDVLEMRDERAQLKPPKPPRSRQAARKEAGRRAVRRQEG
jgi:hypothetical protein